MGKNNSFLPEDYLDRKVARRTNLISVMLFVVMIGAIGAAFYVQSRQDSGTRGELVAVNQKFSDRAAQLRQIEQLQDRQQQMIDKAKVVRQLVERVPRSIVLAEMINNMPTSLSLLEFQLETKNAPQQRTLTAMDRAQAQQQKAKDQEAGKVEIIPREVFVEVVGVAPKENDVTDFMSNLSHHPLFGEAGLEYIQKTTIEQTELFRFRIVMQLNMELIIDRSAPEQLERDLIQDPMAENIQINEDGQLIPPAGGGVANSPTNTD